MESQGRAIRADSPGVRVWSWVSDPGGAEGVVINNDFSKEIEVEVTIPDSHTLVAVTPEAEDPKPHKGKLRILARSAAVVME